MVHIKTILPKQKKFKKTRNINPITMIRSIKSISLNKFRQFENKKIEIAPRITAISGHNATGKSTILALLGNSCELKTGKPFIKTKFRVEFREMIKASLNHDSKTMNAVNIMFEPIDPTKDPFSVPFRSTWQASNTRFRLIPKHENKESKLGYPVLYLGLSRLYPLGECDYKRQPLHTNDISSYLASHQDDKNWLIAAYKKILNQNEVLDIDAKKHPDAKQKIFVGIKNDDYDELCNSAGQDNLGQILLSILSFKRLKEDFSTTNTPWYGGLLLIDEIDATLHPAAQTRLLDLLFQEAETYDLQIIFTTHSLSILDYFSRSPILKSNFTKNKLVYITNQNNELEILTNPKFSYIKNDMLVLDPATLPSSKISVLTEDKETRWFLKEILPDYLKRQIELPDMERGCEAMASFNQQTHPALANSLIVLDGDFPKDKYHEFNLLILPGGNSPEAIIYNFLHDLLPNHEILHNPTFPLSKRVLNDYGPFSAKYSHKKKNREKYKAWFRHNEMTIFSLNVISYWKELHSTAIEEFLEVFKEKLIALQRKRLKK